MICALVENLLDLHVLGRLVPVQARMVESHLASCPACAAQARTWRRTFSELKSLPVAEAPADLKSALKRALAAAAAPEPPPAPVVADDWRPARVPPLVLAFGCAAFLISVSISIFGPGLASQSCSDGSSSVCLLPFASNSALRINP
jgi:anti-sigma factor RsiW